MNKIIEDIKKLEDPFIIAISGFGGSGKTTLANKLSIELNIPVISIDSFWKSNSKDYSNWGIVDFKRFKHEVLIPFKDNFSEIEYGIFSWEKNGIASKTRLKNNGKLIIEGVGIFRPELIEYFDYKIWVDLDLEKSLERGKKRDRQDRNCRVDEEWDKNWDTVWKKNDKEFFENFNPKGLADLVYNND